MIFLLLSGQTVDIVYYVANNILNTIYAWFYKNKLKLINLFKSKCTFFTKIETIS